MYAICSQQMLATISTHTARRYAGGASGRGDRVDHRSPSTITSTSITNRRHTPAVPNHPYPIPNRRRQCKQCRGGGGFPVAHNEAALRMCPMRIIPRRSRALAPVQCTYHAHAGGTCMRAHAVKVPPAQRRRVSRSCVQNKTKQAGTRARDHPSGWDGGVVAVAATPRRHKRRRSRRNYESLTYTH